MYRELANDLNVTSVDLATSAATIYRQGYTDNREVSDIITGATKFGAVSDLTAEESIKSMTASLQNYREEGESAKEVVEKIGDTWSYMGDAVATEGKDIAAAMGKASASVKSVGVEFEQASAYAAIMLARTQQTGEVIGTQLNSLATRYAKITSKGYEKITSDDEGVALSFNDVSKALQEVGIEMYDIANKTFIPMSDVLDELGLRWNSFDEAIQKNIATTMAGTRGMNYFLTLMQNYDHALALQDEAMANRGVVNEKYMIWMQGVEAAQNNLTNSMERFYSILSANTLTDFYNGFAGIVDHVSDATEAMDGFNLKIPIAIAGLLSIVTVAAKAYVEFKKLKDIFKAADKATDIARILPSNIGLIVGIATTALTLIGTVMSSIETQAERFESLKEQIGVNQSEVEAWQNVSGAIGDLGEMTAGTSKYTEAFNKIRKQIVETSPGLQAAFGSEGEGIKSIADATKIANEQLHEHIELQKLLDKEALSGFEKTYNEAFDRLHGGYNDFMSFTDMSDFYGFGVSDYLTRIENTFGNMETTDLGEYSIDMLKSYKEEIQSLINGEYVDIEDSNIVEALGEWLNKISTLLYAKEKDFAEQKDTILGMIAGITAGDETLSDLKYNNGSIYTDALNKFMLSDFTELDAPEIEEAFRRYMSIVQKTIDGWDFSDQASALASGFFFDESGIDTSFIQRYVDAYSDAMDAAFNNRSDVGRKFAEKLQDGDFSIDALEMFNEMTEGMNASQIEEQMAIFVGASIEELNKLIEAWKNANSVVGETADGIANSAAELRELVAPATAAQKALKTLADGEELNGESVKELIEEYPELADEILDYANNTKDATKLIKELNKVQADHAITQWADGIENALDSLDGATEGTRAYDKALQELGIHIGGGLGNLDSLTMAQSYLDDIRAAANGSADAFMRLQNVAFVNVVGTSNVDFSNIMNGIVLADDAAVHLGNMLASLGLFTVETKTLTSAQEILQLAQDGLGYTTQTVRLNGSYQILKPATANPFSSGKYSGGSAKKSSGGGGGGGKGSGGGGSGGSISVSEKTTNMLEGMEKANDAFENRKTIMELRKEYHDIRGEIQGVIAYTEEESKIIEEQNKTLEANVAKLWAEIKAKEAIMASNKTSSKAYKQAAVDLDELNAAHKEYTEALLENKNRLEEIRKELEEFEEDARQATISVQDLIRETLEGYTDAQRDMLDATVDLEDEIIEVLTARYEREQDLAIETTEKKKEAIQAEIDAIDELISAREKLIEKEEQEQEIAELEAKIARISADPTRKKELLQLQEQLADKRKEMALESYRDELEAQKESLEGQITNLDEYIDSVNAYYEELFNNPKKLIAEMKEIIKMSDQEIIDWLSTNHEEFASYSDKKKEQAIQDWQEMINAMRGVTENYRDEIEEIMSWTDEEIMNWLKQNNVEFKDATKEQQDSFLHSWKQTLEEWRSAYKSVSADVSSATYSSGNAGSSGGGGGSGSSGGSGGSSSVGSVSAPKSYKGEAGFQYKKPGGKWSGTISSSIVSKTSQADALNRAIAEAFALAKSSAISAWKKSTLSDATKNTALKYIEKATATQGLTYFQRAYKTGGLAYETGPAWLDGTPAKPERVLSAYQTQLFEDLIATLHTIKTLSVNGISAAAPPNIQAGQSGLTVERIIVNVESLNDDADYELMAMRVGDVLKKELMRSMPAGGLMI